LPIPTTRYARGTECYRAPELIQGGLGIVTRIATSGHWLTVYSTNFHSNLKRFRTTGQSSSRYARKERGLELEDLQTSQTTRWKGHPSHGDARKSLMPLFSRTIHSLFNLVLSTYVDPVLRFFEGWWPIRQRESGKVETLPLHMRAYLTATNRVTAIISY
jgi:hypothetical protein